MKFAFSNLACPAWPIERVADEASRLGYDGVELRLLDGEIIDPMTERAKVEDAVGLIRRRSVEVCAFDTSCRFNLVDAEARAQQITLLLAWIRLAQEAQVPIVRVFGGAGDPHCIAAEDESNGWVTGSLLQVAEAAERAGVTVALETHDAYSSAHRVARVLDAVASRYVAALWDIDGTYRTGESAKDVVNILGPRIAHVHVRDARRVAPGSDGWQLVLLGDGEVPVREQLHLLAHRSYTGYISVEWEKKWQPQIAEPEVALPQHIVWLKECVAAEV